MNISLVIPCYNEALNIEKALASAADALAGITGDYEIIVVNDGSTDRTAALVDAFSHKNPKIRLVSHLHNEGYGAAVRSGFRAAKKEMIFLVDGDNQFDINEIRELLPYIDNYDIVAGYRIRRRDAPVRIVYAALWNYLIRFLLGVRVKDINCAFKLFRKKVLDSIELRSNGALINAEIFAKAAGASVHQIGVSHFPRTNGTQTGGSIRVIMNAFRELRLLYGEVKRTAL